tara:strand:- start:1468 stop:1620 length:153 start_codon:yes stop_codon:yes gene_type:complete
MIEILILLIGFVLGYVLGYAIGIETTIKTIRQAFKYEGYTYEKFHDVINK